MAAYSIAGRTLPRRATHRAFEKVRPHIVQVDRGETLEGLRGKVLAAKNFEEALEAFSDIGTEAPDSP